MTASGRLRVLYILGYGRSGTTVFDIALGQHPAVFGGGEITALSQHVWNNNEYCACGRAIHVCPVWSAVVEQWLRANEDPLVIERYRSLQEKAEGRLGLLRGLLGIASNKSHMEYARVTVGLFRAMALVSGCDLIVDSSKTPGRAFALARIPEVDLHIVHLVRDGRAVAWSMLKGFDRNLKAGLQREIQPKSVVRTATRWSLVNMASEVLGWRLGRDRSIRVRYEDFTADPASALHRVGQLVGLDCDQVGSDLKQRKVISPTHQVAGNRLRMRGELTIERDDRWRAEMPALKQAAFRRLCGWMLRRYDYL